MPTTTARPTTMITRGCMTGDQLALPSSERVVAGTRYGDVTGGRVLNDCQVFLNVPYAQDVERWEDPQPLPESFRYTGEYTVDGKYCAQPDRDYTLQMPVRDRLGLGKPAENPFFADIYVPSDFHFSGTTTTNGHTNGHCDAATAATAATSRQQLRPVRVFIHGGFLQFGSTSGDAYNQQFFAAEQFGEVRVLLGHRVSVFGFLASEHPRVSGNYGFKDCWMGLQWIQENIASFGGDPEQVHLSGLSGGAHIVHQLLQYAAIRAPQRAPFVTALLQSNAILAPPLTRLERAEQFSELCAQLGADAKSPGILADLRDQEKYPTEAIIAAVQRMGSLSTFRGVAADDEGWSIRDILSYQRNSMGRDLRSAGVKCVITGDVRDESVFYSVVHDAPRPADILPNVARYYPLHLAEALCATYPPLEDDATPQECQARLGRVLADGQVHLPVRLLAKDLSPHIPTVRYTIEMVAEALGYNGNVSHGSDLAIQHFRLSVLNNREISAALEWIYALRDAVRPALVGEGFVQRPPDQVLCLLKNGRTAWVHDWRWDELRDKEKAVRPL